MRKLLIPIIIVVAIIALVAALLIPSYNGFVDSNEDVNQAYAQVENQLQRRVDLIPNLVETVKGFAEQEREILTEIADARARLAGADSPGEQAEADNELAGALSRLLVIVENYPELKSDANFRQLMDELAGTENRLAVARQDYNESVSLHNRKVNRMPGALIAGVFGFDEREYFEAEDGAEDAPEVDFGSDGE
ncbi:LemA family protein [Chryseomicrobium palamuruense]|uniref:LemA family protein n=1 Tax=Chryseomicrobium palamuruense TaxID=682973 RepID=A0ABV8UX83_9BACL